MNLLFYLLLFAVGAAIGSFMNVCIHRMPRNESVVVPASRCPVCRVPIRARDNIPLASFLLLRGRCRGCGSPISWRYPAVEGANALAYVVLFTLFPFSAAVVYALLFSSLVVVTFIDFSHRIIPDEITIPGMIVGLFAGTFLLADPFTPHALLARFSDAAIGLVLGGSLFYLVAVASERVLKKEGMGGGDIKLIAMIGAFLGWRGVLLTIFLSAIAGSAYGVALMLFAGKDRSYPVPFGPFLSLGALIALCWGSEILRWYFYLGR